MVCDELAREGGANTGADAPKAALRLAAGRMRPRNLCRGNAMISSAALPNVALRRPPTPSPARAASCSVAAPIHAASGSIANEEDAKTSRCRSGATISRIIATGRNARSQFRIMNQSQILPIEVASCAVPRAPDFSTRHACLPMTCIKSRDRAPHSSATPGHFRPGFSSLVSSPPASAG